MNLSAVVRQIPGLGWGVLLVFLLEAVVLGLVIGFIMMPPRPDSILAAKSAKCDEAVTTLLTTRDIVEMERAKFLISWLDCNVSRRLPR